MATPVQLPLQVVLGLVDKITRPWQRVNAQLRQQVQSLRQMGSQWTSNVTNPVMAFGRFAVGAASTWEDAAARIQLFTRSTAEQAEASAAEIRKYADDAGVSIEDLAGVIGDAAKKFQGIDELNQAMQLTAKLSRLMGKGPAEAFELIRGTSERFGAQLPEIENVLSRMESMGDAADLVEQLKRLGRSKRFRDLGLTNLAAALSARQEGKGGWREAARFLERNGVTQELINKGLAKLAKQPSLEESMGILNGGTSTGLTRLKNQIIELGIAFDKAGIKDALIDVLHIVTPVVQWFRQLPAPVKTFGVFLAMGLAVLGPILTGIAGLAVLFNPVVAIAVAVAAAFALIAANWDAITATAREFATWVDSHADWLVPDSWTSKNMPPPMKELSPKTVGAMNKNKADVTVRLKGFPPGTTVDTKGDARITTDLGVSLMPQLGGAH